MLPEVPAEADDGGEAVDVAGEGVADEVVAVAADGLTSLKAKAAELSRKIDAIVKDGGKVARNAFAFFHDGIGGDHRRPLHIRRHEKGDLDRRNV